MLTNTNIFSIPPQDESDVVFRATSGKWRAVVVEISRMNKTGRPVLVGTTSVEQSDALAGQLLEAGILHEVRHPLTWRNKSRIRLI
jgi:preprotein translocase subunit SecA